MHTANGAENGRVQLAQDSWLWMHRTLFPPNYGLMKKNVVSHSTDQNES